MTRRRWYGVAMAAALGVALLTAGCQRGVNWELGTYRDAHEKAAKANKLTWAYFRNWYSVDCTRFEDNVLMDPQVLAETEKFLCVPLEYGPMDRPLAQRWGITKVPAYAIVTPDDRLLVRRSAPITKEEILEDMRSALATYQSATQPVAKP